MTGYWGFPLVQFSKFKNFLWVCWFLYKILSNFVSLPWKLHNPYCHNLHTQDHYIYYVLGASVRGGASVWETTLFTWLRWTGLWIKCWFWNILFCNYTFYCIWYQPTFADEVLFIVAFGVSFIVWTWYLFFVCDWNEEFSNLNLQ